MATFKEKIVGNILQKVSAFFETDDLRLDIDWVWQQVIQNRSVFIERLLNEKKRLPESFYSRIILDVTEDEGAPAVPDPVVPGSEKAIYVEEPISGKKFAELPPLLSLENNIRYVGTRDLGKQYTRTGLNDFLHLAGREWTGTEIFYVVFPDRLFFSGEPVDENGNAVTKVLAWVLLENIEDDPNFDDDTAIIPGHYQSMLEDLIVDLILKYAREGLLSVKNDASDTKPEERE